MDKAAPVFDFCVFDEAWKCSLYLVTFRVESEMDLRAILEECLRETGTQFRRQLDHTWGQLAGGQVLEQSGLREPYSNNPQTYLAVVTITGYQPCFHSLDAHDSELRKHPASDLH
jgi:hypothetical protein